VNKFIQSIFGAVQAGAPKALAFGKQMGGGALTRATSFLRSDKLSHQIKFQGLIAGVTMLGHGTPEEKMKAVGNQMLLFWMTAGMNSSWRQGLWQLGLMMAPHLPDAARSITQGYRGVLESRTMAAVPFSYSTLAMDQAAASMQYAQGRMGAMYGSIGSEAQYMAARYMQR
jgi:hypothetical protein